MSSPILFTSMCKPFEKILRFSATDQMAYRLTRGQGPFVLYEHTHIPALHLMAQNLSCPSIVLEYPTIDQFVRELERGYPLVAISFKAPHIDRLLEMCTLIRKKSPNSRIAVGGQGVICLPEYFKDHRWDGMIDEVCADDGIAFMRRVLGEAPADHIHCQLPKIGSTIPWVNPQPVGTIGIVLSALGCTHCCPFCATSASTKGKYIEVMNASDIYQSMRGYWESSPMTNSLTIYDENFLDQKEKVTALGRFIQQDEKFGLRRLNYFAFGSLSALSKYEPEELLLNGIDTLWVGVESKFSPLGKRSGMDVVKAFQMLHSIGIKTVGSWIIGQDFQTPENLEEDMNFFVSLDPTFQQLAILTVSPGLPLWEELASEKRIPAQTTCKDYHIYGHSMIYKHFTHDKLLAHLDHMYRRIYLENGPALTKVLEVNLNGYQWCIKSRNPLLRHEKSQYFRNRCESYYLFLKTARMHAPSERVRYRLDLLDQLYKETFGEIEPYQVKLADQFLRKADEALQQSGEEPPPAREEPFRRYMYPPRHQRSCHHPYKVEYPEIRESV